MVKYVALLKPNDKAKTRRKSLYDGEKSLGFVTEPLCQ